MENIKYINEYALTLIELKVDLNELDTLGQTALFK